MPTDPPPARIDSSPAFECMAFDLLQQILPYTNNPETLGTQLVSQLRELSGAHTVLLFQCQHQVTDNPHQLIAIDPERRHREATTTEVAGVFELTHTLRCPEIFDAETQEIEKDPTSPKGMPSIAAPLRIKSTSVGTLLLIGLPDTNNIQQIMNVIETLSAITALVLQQSFRFGSQQQILQTVQTQIKQFMEHIQAPAFIRDKEGRHLYMNPFGQRYFGEKPWRGLKPHELFPKELADAIVDEDRTTLEQSFLHSAQSLRGPDGRLRHFDSYKFRLQDDDGQPILGGIALEDTAKWREQSQRAVEARILQALNQPQNLHELLHNALMILRASLHIDSFGIRLREGESFPYFESIGLSEDFLREASDLCTRNGNDAPVLDCKDEYALACLCGTVLLEQTDPALDFFTEAGSFATNSLSNFFRNQTELLREISARNHCLHAGFESLALIPLKSSGVILGLLQVSDPHKGVLEDDRVKFLERLAGTISLAIDRNLKQEATLRARSLSRAVALASQQFLLRNDVHAMEAMIVEEAVHLTDAKFGILLTCHGQDRIRIQTTYGFESLHLQADTAVGKALRAIEEQGFFEMPLGENLFTLALRQGEPVLTNSARNHSGWTNALPKGHPTIESFLAVPVKHGMEVVGMVAVANRSNGFATAHKENLSELGSSIAMALQAIRQEAEKHSVEAQLQQAQKMESIGRLAGGVAHDFNNMLSVISGYTELAMANTSPDDPIHQDLFEIEKAAERSAALTRQLLAFARKQTIAPEPSDLNKLIESCNKMVERLVGEEISVEFNPRQALWTIQVDPSQIDQILVNLAVNSRDAIGGPGKIVITTANSAIDASYCSDHLFAQPGDYVCLRFSDDGCGIPDEVVGNIFEPFFTLKEHGAGTGLGLSTVYGIVKQSEGWITVESEPGTGTSFTLYFPRIHEARERPSAAEPASVLTGTETILLVEDDAQVLRLIKRMLDRFGYTVITTNSPGDACVLAEASRTQIDLLLTDVIMPSMSGKALQEQLESVVPNLKVLFMSGYTANAIADRGILAEGTHFIQKPFTRKNLGIKIREVLDS